MNEKVSIVLDRTEIMDYIERHCQIKRTYHVQYADEYSADPYPFYIKSAEVRPVVIHPDFGDGLRRQPIYGVQMEDLYFNSALRAFPRLEGGRERCGYDLGIADLTALDAVLIRIGATPKTSTKSASELHDIELAAMSLTGVPETERAALIAARLGQGVFRDRLMQIWNGRCAVTGTGVSALLRASHIKPWRVSNNRERLDSDNGLLPIANLDAAFDAGLMSFKDDGTILLSAKLGPAPHELLGIKPAAKLVRPPSVQQRAFLKHHRNTGGYNTA